MKYITITSVALFLSLLAWAFITDDIRLVRYVECAPLNQIDTPTQGESPKPIK